MGTIQQGRQGSIGFAFQTDEDTPNTTPSVYLPWNVNTIQGRHEPISVQHSVASRRMNESSVQGRKWCDGDLGVNLDMINSGYLIKWALGNELLATGTPNEHTLYTTVSGNTPRFATLIHTFGDTAIQQLNGVACNTLSLSVSDTLAELTAGVLGKFPVSGETQTPTTLSGTVLAFPTYNLKLGADLSAAESASPTPAQEFNLDINNNLEQIWSSQKTAGTNSNDVRTTRLGNLEITGNYMLFFDSVTERDAHYNLIKRAAVVTFGVGGLEELKINMSKFRVNEKEIETGLDDLYAITGNFVVETDRSQVPNDINVVLKNNKSTIY